MAKHLRKAAHIGFGERLHRCRHSAAKRDEGSATPAQVCSASALLLSLPRLLLLLHLVYVFVPPCGFGHDIWMWNLSVVNHHGATSTALGHLPADLKKAVGASDHPCRRGTATAEERSEHGEGGA